LYSVILLPFVIFFMPFNKISLLLFACEQDLVDEAGPNLHTGAAELSSSDLVDRVYRRIVESHAKHYGWQVSFYKWQVLHHKFIKCNTLTFALYYVSCCLQPADRWGMKLVGTPCGNSLWVTAGEAEEAVEKIGMDAVNATRLCSKVATPKS
jgi:hypothetical protein